MYQVLKRDGQVADFAIAKIGNAIAKAFEASNRQSNPDIIDLLALRVTADYETKIKDNHVSVEEIQDSVESVLQSAGYTDVAKNYILYRKQREKIRNVGRTMLDYKDLVNSYVDITDWRVK
ncbi:MAG: ATP cone domain-containing protein, partial [Eubacteriales bacterium]